jgi:hypothetical protein
MLELNLMRQARGVSLAAVAGFQLLAAPALTIPPGTEIPVTIDQNIALKRGQIGKSFAAHVTRDVVVNRAVAIPAGDPAEVVLIESPDTPGAASFRVARLSIGGRMRPVRTDVARADATRSGMSTAKKTGIGAIAGGVIGLVTGGGGGFLKGAAVGAGGGLAWGLLDKGTTEVKANTPLTFALSDPVQVR